MAQNTTHTVGSGATISGRHDPEVGLNRIKNCPRNRERYTLTIVLKEDIIKHRATVFEENSMEFCRRHRIVVGDPVPSGYRATWQNRHELARAKLHPQLTASTSAGDFPKILLKPADANNPDSFIEVHIYGSFNRRGVESVVATGLKKREDKVLLKSMKTRLKEIGATLTEV